MAHWQPTLGAVIQDGITSFRVWAPLTASLEVEVTRSPGRIDRRPLAKGDDGMFAAAFDDLPVGTRYGYVLDGDGPFPDPASRWQPDGVHGLSATIDPAAFAWTDQAWRGVPLSDVVLYELHVGTFSREGNFAAVAARLQDLQALGVTTLELVPVAEFPGARNWGYDGAALFAPEHSYGRPDDLRLLVDLAHSVSLAVILDVVYNHTGPDGSYLSRFSPFYFSDRHMSPWGAGLSFDGEHSARVRAFFIENALHWVHEYHLDGLRLDATHAILDDSRQHFVAELAARVKDSVDGRHVHVIAEDHRNLACMIAGRDHAGWGLDAVWADDFHHQMRRLLVGDAEGYYRDYAGTTRDIATTIRQGWYFTGQWSEHLGGPRGTEPAGLDPSRFVMCLQNHDQVGNRALGERLNHQVPLPVFRAASLLFLLLPHTPLLFMGQEWAAMSPFLYFTDHTPDLGRLVTEGRRREFATFAAFSEAAARVRIPDPQAVRTFEASCLDWSERDREPHASIVRLYQAALRYRHQELRHGAPGDAATAFAPDDDTVAFCRTSRSGGQVLVVARLRGAGALDLGRHPEAHAFSRATPVFTSEDAAFASRPHPPVIDMTGTAPIIRFAVASTVVLRQADR